MLILTRESGESRWDPSRPGHFQRPVQPDSKWSAHRGADRGIRSHLRISPPEGGLTKPSLILCDQARAQSELRFMRRRGQVSADIVRHVQQLVGECIDRWRPADRPSPGRRRRGKQRGAPIQHPGPAHRDRRVHRPMSAPVRPTPNRPCNLHKNVVPQAEAIPYNHASLHVLFRLNWSGEDSLPAHLIFEGRLSGMDRTYARNRTPRRFRI